ncbi:hypothetical protein CERZMDRAFT_100976 [Cercospora zeae-maydis SCOH1-5]|uniref:Uncharacterized protein n=1 Tax=Cercospora zeae-maydis SCOH1-5 TaxID=717836 RepID=A0A6A6F705_9PEZI|nr:hypothetical protein CERZMDRAFT_100976 [Cercospora zeae-maydis SCOH1-5]
MLALQSSSSKQKPKPLQPNILPCQIHHSGPIPIAQRHWSPQPTSASFPSTPNCSSATQTAHFRGRKLVGKTIALPNTYTGIVAQKTTRQLSQPIRPPPSTSTNDVENEDEEQQSLPPETFILEPHAEFNSITIWSHESIPSNEEDCYIKGVEEWIGFAESTHAYDSPRPTGET